LGKARRLSRPLGGSQALHLRQEAVAPRTRRQLRASFFRPSQLALRPLALGQLLEAGLLAQ
jgi:hypothetical protein